MARLFEMEGVNCPSLEDALGSVAPPRHRPQDRSARLALHHGEHSAGNDVRLASLDGVEEVVINREVAESRAKSPVPVGKERAENQRLCGLGRRLPPVMKLSRSCDKLGA